MRDFLNNIYVIGAGGIGTNLLPNLIKMCEYSPYDFTICVIDGDKVEHKNLIRQHFTKHDLSVSKAQSIVKRLDSEVSRTKLYYIEKYVNKDNIDEIIKDGGLIFICVDNHATRKLIDDYCERLYNSVIINGGNDDFDGNVQLVQRLEGKTLSPTLCLRHNEIAEPDDKNPSDMSCEELARSGEIQYLATNNMAASIMLNMFHMLINDKLPLNIIETFFDIKKNECSTIQIETDENKLKSLESIVKLGNDNNSD